jgi:hypothetical protein
MRRRRTDNPPPICGCTHHLAYHDPTTGVCTKHVSRTGAYVKAADEWADEWVQCDCKQYVGPRPAMEFFTSDVAWDSSIMRTERDGAS